MVVMKMQAVSAATSVQLHTGIAAWTCHQPGSVFDLVPGDLVSSAILAAAAAVTKVICMLLCCAVHCLPMPRHPLMAPPFVFS